MPSVDPETLRRARQVASRLALRRPRRDTTARRGAGDLTSVRYRGGSDDIDLDRTLDQLVEHPVPEDDDIIVREQIRTRRSVILLVDVSGSMRGERVRTAAATVGALASELVRDDTAVVAFWSDAAILAHLGQRVPPGRLLDTMMRIPAKGLTNVAFVLEVAARELRRVPARDARAVLLSDCVHNAGPDPRPFAAPPAAARRAARLVRRARPGPGSRSRPDRARPAGAHHYLPRRRTGGVDVVRTLREAIAMSAWVADLAVARGQAARRRGRDARRPARLDRAARPAPAAVHRHRRRGRPVPPARRGPRATS